MAAAATRNESKISDVSIVSVVLLYCAYTAVGRRRAQKKRTKYLVVEWYTYVEIQYVYNTIICVACGTGGSESSLVLTEVLRSCIVLFILSRFYQYTSEFVDRKQGVDDCC